MQSLKSKIHWSELQEQEGSMEKKKRTKFKTFVEINISVTETQIYVEQFE